MESWSRAETSHNEARLLASAVLDGTLSLDEALDMWCASGWQPPAGVTSGTFDGTWRIVAAGRRKPVVGVPKRDEHGWFYAPANRNHLRAADAELLDGVASVAGVHARVPRTGRPRRGRGEAAARYVESEVANGVPRLKAMQAAYERFGWDTDSIERHLRRRARALGQ